MPAKKKHKKLVACILLALVVVVACLLYINRHIFTQMQNTLAQRQAKIQEQRAFVAKLISLNQAYIPLAQGEKNNYCYIIAPLDNNLALLNDYFRAGANTQKNLCGQVYYIPVVSQTASNYPKIAYIFNQLPQERQGLLMHWQELPNGENQALATLAQWQKDFALSSYEFPIFIKYQVDNQASSWYDGQRAQREILQFKP